MNLDKMVTLAYKTKWDKINNYTFQITGKQVELFNKFPPGTLNLALKSVTIPPLNIAPIETYMGGQWFYTNGRPDMARVELTFRDFGSFSIYKAFTNLYEKCLIMYPDEVYINIMISQDGPTGDEIKLIEIRDVLIENVSQLNFSSETENQIAEFSVTVRGERQRVAGTSRANVKKLTFETV